MATPEQIEAKRTEIRVKLAEIDTVENSIASAKATVEASEDCAALKSTRDDAKTDADAKRAELRIAREALVAAQLALDADVAARAEDAIAADLAALATKKSELLTLRGELRALIKE
jgi:hypothetical protein